MGQAASSDPNFTAVCDPSLYHCAYLIFQRETQIGQSWPMDDLGFESDCNQLQPENKILSTQWGCGRHCKKYFLFLRDIKKKDI